MLELGTAAGLRLSARSRSTAALSRYAMAVPWIQFDVFFSWVGCRRVLTVCRVHNVIQIVQCQASICVRLPSDAGGEVIAFVSGLVPPLSREQVC